MVMATVVQSLTGLLRTFSKHAMPLFFFFFFLQGPEVPWECAGRFCVVFFFVFFWALCLLLCLRFRALYKSILLPSNS